MASTKETLYFDFGDFRLDIFENQLLKNGRPVSITNKAFQTLLILVRNAGEVVEKETIISQIWTDTFVEESNLSQYIYVLRKILGKDENGKHIIETINKEGYRFTAPVKAITEDAREQSDTDSEINPATSVQKPAVNLSGDSREPGAGNIKAPVLHEEKSEDSAKIPGIPPKSEKQKQQLLLLAAIVLGIVIISSVVYFYRNHQAPATQETALTKSIAVLPFRIIGEENSDSKLGLGMADAIIMRLSKLKKIPVRSTGSVFPFVEAPVQDPIAAGRSLGVQAVLVGTIQREGDKFRVSVQLVNVDDGRSIWAESYNETLTDIFAVQDSISSKVAEALDLKLTREQEQILARRATKNPQAFQAYQSGIYFLNKRSHEDLLKAIENFQKAIELDPNYAQAYAGLSDSYNLLDYFKLAENRDDNRKKALAAAEKALDLDNTLAEAYMAMAYNQSDFSTANYQLERAIELSPYNSNIRVRYAWMMLNFGNLEEAVRQARLAQEYDPVSTVSNNVLCGFLSFQNKFEEAVPFCENALRISPNAPRNRLVLAKVYFFMGRREEAVTQLKTQINLTSGFEKDEALALLSYFYARTGARAEAEQIFSDLKPKSETEEPGLLNYFVLTAYALGRKNEALNLFNKAKKEQNYFDQVRFRYDPLWEEIRRDERFSI